ncbi:MAG: Spy/CpxP family protein refolding chaperone [Candidatus Methylomirabilis sp.]
MRAWNGLVVGLLMAMMTAGGTIASAQKEPAKPPPDPFQNLGLSTEQRSKLDTASNQRMESLKASQQKSVEIRKKLGDLLFSKKASDKEIDKTGDHLSKVETERLLAEIKFHKTLRRVLTQEQLTTLNKGGK